MDRYRRLVVDRRPGSRPRSHPATTEPMDAAAAAAAFQRGATAVTVGTAITHPASITRWFRKGIAQELKR